LGLTGPAERVMDIWRGIQGVHHVTVDDGTVTLLMDDSNRVLPSLFESANQNKVRITSVEIQEPNLEAVFLHLTGRALRD
jgi:ABC-2 type transport system ATP-binding protein